MAIRFLCFNCAAKIKVPDGTHGRKVKCPSCGSMQRVPAESAPPADQAAVAPPPEVPPEVPPAPEEAPPEAPVEAPAETPSEHVESPQPAEAAWPDPGQGEEPVDEEPLDPLAALAAAAGDGEPMADMPTQDILSQLNEDSTAEEPAEVFTPAPSPGLGEESPALPWADINEAASAPMASEDESPPETPETPEPEEASPEPPEPAAIPVARPASPRGGTSPAVTELPAVARRETPDPSPDAPGTAVAPGVAAAAAGAAVAASQIRPKPQPAPASPKAIPLGHASSFRSTMARPQPVPQMPGESPARPQPAQSLPAAAIPTHAPASPTAGVSQSAVQAGGISGGISGGMSDFARPRPLYRGLKTTAMMLRVVAVILLAVTLLQALSWQRSSLADVLGDSGDKLVYALRVAVPLALSAIAWGLAECCAGLRTLLRQ